eukprot:gene17049-22559_t
MGNVLTPTKPLKEIIRENQRMIKKSIRELEREIRDCEKNEKKLNTDVRKAIKENQTGAARVMVKDLVRTKKTITKFIELKTHLNAVSLKMQTVKSTQAMADAMKGVTKALISTNKQIDLPSLNKIMAEFMKENEKNEIMQEMIGDSIDDAMEVEGSSEEEELIFNQILDEVGAKSTDAVPEAPKQSLVQNAEPAARDQVQSDLENRLNDL